MIIIINFQTNGKQNSLHLASCNKNAEATLECLLMHPDLDLFLVNNQGKTALDLLASSLTKNAYLFEMVETIPIHTFLQPNYSPTSNEHT